MQMQRRHQECANSSTQKQQLSLRSTMMNASASRAQLQQIAPLQMRLDTALDGGDFYKAAITDTMKLEMTQSRNAFAAHKLALQGRKNLLNGLGIATPQTTALFAAADAASRLSSYLVGKFSKAKRDGLRADHAIVTAAETGDLAGQATAELDGLYPARAAADNLVITQNNGEISGWLAAAAEGRSAGLTRLVEFLAFDDGNFAHRYGRLSWFNTMAGTSLLELKVANVQASSARLNTVHAAISPLAGSQLAGARRMGSAATGFYELLKSATRQPNVDDLRATSDDIHTEGDHFDNFGLKDLQLQIVQAARAVYPRDAALPGLAWGPGNAGGVAENKKEHFKKHCLRLGNVANPDQAEPWKWKTHLGYDIRRDHVEAAFGAAVVSPDTYFGGDGRVSDQDRANRFFNEWLPGKNAVIEDLYTRHGATYENAITGATAGMANKYVSLENGSLYAQGQAGNIYIIAKWYGQAVQNFLVSSGYMNTNRINDNRAYKLWGLT